LEGDGDGLIWDIPGFSLEETITPQKSPVRIAGAVTGIPADYAPNRRYNHYHLNKIARLYNVRIQ
jgi:hypothetical protein